MVLIAIGVVIMKRRVHYRFIRLQNICHDLLPVMQEMIADSIFPEEELNIYKQNSKQNLSVSLKKCDFVANRLIDEYLFGKEHPYGKYLLVEDYDALQTTELKEFFQQHYQNGKCIIFVSGKLPKDIYQQRSINNLQPENRSISHNSTFVT